MVITHRLSWWWVKITAVDLSTEKEVQGEQVLPRTVMVTGVVQLILQREPTAIRTAVLPHASRMNTINAHGSRQVLTHIRTAGQRLNKIVRAPGAQGTVITILHGTTIPEAVRRQVELRGRIRAVRDQEAMAEAAAAIKQHRL